MSEHKFRYLLPPGSNFQFVAKFKYWVWLSIILTIATIAILFVNKSVRGEYMNWTIDFRGGTEMILAFRDKATGVYTKVEAAKLRELLEKTGETGIEVSEISYVAQGKQGEDVPVTGMILRMTQFSALKPGVAQQALDDFSDKFKDREISKGSWSGDRLSIHGKKPITHAEATALFAKHGLELKPWDEKETVLYTRPDESTGEVSQWFSIRGLDRQYEQRIEKELPTIDVEAVQSYGVGAKAGDKLRDDAVKSIIYAIFLIMLYLAFRFDIRYAPGAAFATLHDAVMVIGVFALFNVEVSLTSVAGLLTVMGYSVNETVIGFDRIRENEAKLKDKKIERIIDISINERLVRTLMTSSTVFATTLVMNVFGAGLVSNFAFAMNVGVIVATYSSIFLAAPVFLWISKKYYSGPAPARRRYSPVSVVDSSETSTPTPEE
jgi:preprotein translocase subunit SecF